MWNEKKQQTREKKTPEKNSIRASYEWLCLNACFFSSTATMSKREDLTIECLGIDEEICYCREKKTNRRWKKRELKRGTKDRQPSNEACVHYQSMMNSTKEYLRDNFELSMRIYSFIDLSFLIKLDFEKVEWDIDQHRSMVFFDFELTVSFIYQRSKWMCNGFSNSHLYSIGSCAIIFSSNRFELHLNIQVEFDFCHFSMTFLFSFIFNVKQLDWFRQRKRKEKGTLLISLSSFVTNQTAFINRSGWSMSLIFVSF